MIGCGGIGSLSGLTLCKMGLPHIILYDDDGVEPHNLPNQFYRKKDLGKFKVEALQEIIEEFTDTKVTAYNKKYLDHKLAKTVVVGTDSMASRKLVWEQFKKQPQCKNYIEARMGAEVARLYVIRKKGNSVSEGDRIFYEETLYSDDKAEQAPCTERAIIYNVMGIASRIACAYKKLLMEQGHYREIVDCSIFMDEDHTICMTRL